MDVKLFNGKPNRVLLKSGETQEFDLIIFVDGSQSIGRTLISEGSQLAYSGYVAWRGTLDFDLVKYKLGNALVLNPALWQDLDDLQIECSLIM